MSQGLVKLKTFDASEMPPVLSSPGASKIRLDLPRRNSANRYSKGFEINSNFSPLTIFSPLKDLEAPAYFVTGNHETYADEKKIWNILTRNGVRVLDNEVVETHGIQLVGLRYMNADDGGGDFHASGGNRTIRNVLPSLNISDDAPAILMHHSPVGIPIAQEAGIDLYIAGHTHGGGQIFPLTLIAGSAFDYSKGLYHYKGMDVYVSQGAGTWFVPMRVGTDNEITLVRLRGSN